MSRNFWIGLIASLAVLVLAAGVLVLVKGSGPDLTLPDELDGMVAQDSESSVEQLDEDRRDEVRERYRDQEAYNEGELSDALGGADVEARGYYDIDSDDGPAFVGVVAAATDTGPLLPEGGFSEPELSGYALPLIERVEDGDVECLVRRNNPPRAGSDYDEEDAAPSSLLCQRTSGSLSVRVNSGSGATVEQIVGYVNEIFDDLD